MTNTLKRWLFLVPLAVVFAGFIVVSLAHAQAPQVMGAGGMNMQGNMGMHVGMGGGGQVFQGVAGKVTAVNGTTLSVQGMNMMMRGGSNGNQSGTNASGTVYSVDASNATVRKNNATSTVSAIAVGDMVFVRGTVNETSVTATSILDGMVRIPGPRGFGPGSNGSSSYPFRHASGTPPFMNASGTGPFAGGTAVSGTIASVNGSTLTVNGSNGTTYTVDITNATLLKQGNATSSISAINVGDSVRIQGIASGTSIMANIVLDNVSTGQNGNSTGGSHPNNILGAITSFLGNLFHFRF